MKPIVKYQGGKSRELPRIMSHVPHFTGRLIEPYCGGAALAFSMNRRSLLADLNADLINLYKVVGSSLDYFMLAARLNAVPADLEKEYYLSRDLLNSGAGTTVDRAYAYMIVKQLCFAGMERYNANNEFNVPFGHYTKFVNKLTFDHHNFLSTNSVQLMDAVQAINMAQMNDFIFVDPPYMDRAGYKFDTDHEDLLYALKHTNAKFLLIHSDNDWYRNNYNFANITEYENTYAQRFGKDKDHSNAQCKHLYITN